MLEYNMDLRDGSRSKICVLADAAQLMPYYLTEYGLFYADCGYFTRRDGKDAALLIYTISGRGAMRTKGQYCELVAGSAIVIYCDEYHEYMTISEEPWAFRWLHVAGAGIGPRSLPMLERPRAVAAPAELKSAFERVELLADSRDILALAEVSHLISGAILYMLRAASERDGARDDVRRVAEFIEQNCAEPLTIDSCARVANISKHHMIRRFHAEMGTPPLRYMHKCRVARAQYLLRTTDMSVAEVAEAVGYADPVNFIRRFKSISNITPARYRKDSIRLPSSVSM